MTDGKPHIFKRDGIWKVADWYCRTSSGAALYTEKGCGTTIESAWKQAYPTRPWWRLW